MGLLAGGVVVGVFMVIYRYVPRSLDSLADLVERSGYGPTARTGFYS
jgi:hypothetical protein